MEGAEEQTELIRKQMQERDGKNEQEALDSLLVVEVPMWVRTALGLVTLVAVVAPNARAFELSADMCWRTESDRIALSGESSVLSSGDRMILEGLHLLRTRVNVKATNEGGSSIFVQIQDSRVVGEPSSGGISQDDELGIQQAFLSVPLFDGAALHAGRQVLAFGDQRIIGAVGWSNVGRTFDGVRLTHMKGKRRVDAFYMKLAERRSGTGRDDDLWGVYAALNPVDLFGIVEYDADKTDEGDRELVRATIGAHAKGTPVSNLQAEATAAYQAGRAGETDLAAFLLRGELAFVPNGNVSRSAVGVDYSSGDDPDSDDYEAFANSFYTGHKFRGYMDQFLASNREGLLDLFALQKVTIGEDWGLTAIAHLFRTVESFQGMSDDEAHTLGFELDGIVSGPARGGVNVVAGGSVFFPTDEWKEETDPELWGFVQLMVKAK
jgi:hypothetical protein